MFWIDQYYWLLVIPAMLISIWAQVRVNSAFAKYEQVSSRSGRTAAETARMILDAAGLYDVRVERVSGRLSDHFDPRTKVVRLSDAVYGSASIAAVGVAAHECGHAMQYAKEYFPMRLRAFLIPLTTIGSNLGIPMAIFGIIFGWELLTSAGIVLFLAVVVFQLITLPVEFNASRRAMATLETQNFLASDELSGARKVLSAAALTYVAALIVALANLFRLILLKNSRRN